ncbi:MAG: ATP-binding protein [Candidatus Aquicultorales bacterium]
MRKRQIVKIDEALCNGCGKCVSPCAEGAIQVIDGKAKVVKEELCDGAGFCLGVCPEGAMTIEVREAPDFDEEAAHIVMEAKSKEYVAQTCFSCGRTEDDAPLIPVRTEGKSTWACVKCLPQLIHG